MASSPAMRPLWSSRARKADAFICFSSIFFVFFVCFFFLFIILYIININIHGFLIGFAELEMLFLLR